MYTTVLPSGKCRCRERGKNLSRDSYARNVLGQDDNDFMKRLPMAERMAWHRDHAALALKDLPHRMTDYICERRSAQTTTSSYAGGDLLDEIDLKEKYKDKPEQLANIMNTAFSTKHPTRGVTVWEDVQLKRGWLFEDQRKMECGREASGSVQMKPLRQGKPPKKANPSIEGEQAKPPKQAKPLGKGLKKQVERMPGTMKDAIGTGLHHINEAIEKGVPAAFILKMQQFVDDVHNAIEGLRGLEESDAAKEAVARAKTVLEKLVNHTSNFVGAIEMIEGDEKAIAAAKHIPLCAAERAQEHKRIVW